GAPVLVVVALRARRLPALLVAAAAIALVAAAMVLSRSRGAWVATALATAAILPGVWRARQVAWQRSLEPARGRRPRAVHELAGIPGGGRALVRRAVVIGIAVVAGIAAAVTLPNTLNW